MATDWTPSRPLNLVEILNLRCVTAEIACPVGRPRRLIVKGCAGWLYVYHDVCGRLGFTRFGGNDPDDEMIRAIARELGCSFTDESMGETVP
jgi:hypothetical protein